jgi:DNA-binding NarL/FixJ family response regulator
MLQSQPDFEVVAEAANGVEAVDLANRHRPDVVLMDLRMPQMDGVAATAEIKKRIRETNVLVLTTYESDADILRAIDVGATGYLLKDAPHEEIFSAVRSTALGSSSVSPAVATRLVDQLRRRTEGTLSRREVEILELVADGKNNKDIAERLWISEATVKSHLNRIFDKLDVKDRTAAVVMALKRGIVQIKP